MVIVRMVHRGVRFGATVLMGKHHPHPAKGLHFIRLTGGVSDGIGYRPQYNLVFMVIVLVCQSNIGVVNIDLCL
nr:hypothetical protein [Providencia stuartii]